MWICVVLATLNPPDVEGGRTLDATESDKLESEFKASCDALRRFGLDLAMLADGTVIGTVVSSGGATDQVHLAARGALSMREMCPDSHIAITTGRAVIRDRTCLGEAVDRAMQFLKRPPASGDDPAAGSIWLDTVTSRLLEGRFRIGPSDGGALLEGALAGLDESRRLLGKPTPCVGRDLELAQIEALLSSCFALARSAKGIEYGALGQALGVLRSIQAIAFYGMASWVQAGAAGVEALELLPRGSVWWCRVAEKLLHILPQIEEPRRFEALVREIQDVEPAPEARSDYVCALSFLLMGVVVVGTRERGRAYTNLIRRAADGVDSHARGVARFTVGAYSHGWEPNPQIAFSSLRESVDELTSSQVLHRLVLAQTVLGSASLDLGDRAAAEDITRRSLASATQIRDPYLTTNAQVYLSWLLSETGDPAKVEEAEALAKLSLKAPPAPSYEGCGYVALGRAALAAGDPARAEDALRRARAPLTGIPVMILMASTYLMKALLRQGRAAEASAFGSETLGLLNQLGGVGFCEIPARVAAVEALVESDQGEAARSLLRETLREIETRAATISDPAMKTMYLSRNKSNHRAFELARSLLGEQEA